MSGITKEPAQDILFFQRPCEVDAAVMGLEGDIITGWWGVATVTVVCPLALVSGWLVGVMSRDVAMGSGRGESGEEGDDGVRVRVESRSMCSSLCEFEDPIPGEK